MTFSDHLQNCSPLQMPSVQVHRQVHTSPPLLDCAPLSSACVVDPADVTVTWYDVFNLWCRMGRPTRCSSHQLAPAECTLAPMQATGLARAHKLLEEADKIGCREVRPVQGHRGRIAKLEPRIHCQCVPSQVDDQGYPSTTQSHDDCEQLPVYLYLSHKARKVASNCTVLQS